MKLTSDAVARNRDLIREVLAKFLPPSGLVLEVASGSGEHALHLAQHLKSHTWQPSDRDPVSLASIAAYQSEAQLPNLMPPLELDVMNYPWPVKDAEAIVCINMVHIAPIQAMQSLFAGAARTLPSGGMLFIYGPFKFHGTFSAPSNADFDRDLRARDPSWGVRDIRELTVAATRAGIGLERTLAMPANNHSLIFRRRPLLPPSGKFQIG